MLPDRSVEPTDKPGHGALTRALILPLLSLAFLVGCDNSESIRVDETRAKLVGTWLREAEVGNGKSRRVLVLGADGKFTDDFAISASGVAPERRELAGELSYDGTNLKRRYLRENGRQFAGGTMRFATFPLVSITSSEFVIGDGIEGKETSFHRVAEGTRP